MWDVALTLEREFGDFEIAAAIAYWDNQDMNDDGDTETIIGSFSIIHKPTGLNFTGAAGEREFNNVFTNNNGVVGTRGDASFYYLKAGILREFNSLGETAFYGEYGNFKDMLSTDTNTATVDSLDSDATAGCGAGVGCLVSGSDAKVWGFGVVQNIDAAHMQLYIAYRHYELDVDVVDNAGAAVAVHGLQDFDTVIAGGRIEF